MVTVSGNLIQPLLRHKLDHRVLLFRLPDDGLHRPVLASVLNKQAVNGLSGTERLQNRVSSLYGQLFVSHHNSPIFFNPRPTSCVSRSIRPARYSQPMSASKPVAMR